ncbi:Por secretion system C-terminal sorting domain-containing protein [Dyadobacter soli]|uniref:Por secretion system C-terminal sorting domain-containing protein n=1 Tax=Dyadobacter soli TaxID=659014 RepID=A0A1G7IRK5_9BACT|nr:T9SS type A sorting domain-containing protein [Dyadobacter soli]SDF15184.1 Por secretion system C-terminal sorting domain-containing protein [Dyadobacter soli]
MLEWIRLAAGGRTYCRIVIICLVIGIIPVKAQLVITSPVSNQVMQRNAAGTAAISVTGYAHYPYTRVDASLVPIEGNANAAQEQEFDARQLSEGFFHTSFTARTGWYRLKLTGTAGNGIVDSAVVDRVGVGEVFLVTGNSNAMGLPGLGAKDASANVVSFNAINKTLNTENITVAPDSPMPPPAFEPLKSAGNIFPNGETSWYWGELGDLLFQRWKTPVLFFNAAWAAANAENYRDAASGVDAYNLYVGKFWPNRQPYSNIVNTMRYLTALTGVRAVLWSHGENDAQLGFNEEQYFDGIRTLIQNGRRDSGYNIAWYIARNSASNQLKDPYLPVLNAQNRLIALPGFNAFQGPFLDTIQIPRPASSHFENVPGGIQGLSLAARAWNRSLADTSIAKTVPLQPAYALHTGVTPANVYPGATFDLPFTISRNAPAVLQIAAELLDVQGQFVAQIGTGNATPLKIQVPTNIPDGQYHIRLTGLNPILPGSVSQPVYVERSSRSVQYVNTIGVRNAGGDIHIAWAVAPVPGLASMTVQKTTDGSQYIDLETLPAPATGTSGVFAFTDENAGSGTIFYRVKMVYSNGTIAYSTIITLFREGAPAPWTIFPNPVTQQQFYIIPASTGTETGITCRLFDAAGREHPIQSSAREAVGLLSVRPRYPLPAGKYVLQVTSGGQKRAQSVVFY